MSGSGSTTLCYPPGSTRIKQNTPYDAVRRVSGLRRKPVIPCTEHPHKTSNERAGVFHERVGVLFFSGMWGSVLGSTRRLQVPYVIPRPGVRLHMYNKLSTVLEKIIE